jgi:Tfp pilus assembly protein PilX
MTTDSRPSSDRDQGAILLLVLAVAIVLSLVVLALAEFVAADLRYAQLVDSQSKRLTSAESGIDYALDRLRLNQTLCATDAASSPVNLNGASSPGTP